MSPDRFVTYVFDCTPFCGEPPVPDAFPDCPLYDAQELGGMRIKLVKWLIFLSLLAGCREQPLASNQDPGAGTSSTER